MRIGAQYAIAPARPQDRPLWTRLRAIADGCDLSARRSDDKITPGPHTPFRRLTRYAKPSSLSEKSR